MIFIVYPESIYVQNKLIIQMFFHIGIHHSHIILNMLLISSAIRCIKS